jgi:hypothetical protein
VFVESMTANTLEPIGPRDAYELYLADCEGELSPNTVQAKRYCLGLFVRWCEGEDNGGEPRVMNLNRLNGGESPDTRTGAARESIRLHSKYSSRNCGSSYDFVCLSTPLRNQSPRR